MALRFVRQILRKFAAQVTRPLQQRAISRANAQWQANESDLKEKFFRLAASSGMPRGLLWIGCEWIGPMRLARERTSGILTAFVGIVARFRPIEGGPMEDVEDAWLPRDATAVFHFRNGGWETDGRTLFNMSPDETLARMADQFESIDTPA